MDLSSGLCRNVARAIAATVAALMLVFAFAVGTAYASDVDVTVDTGESGNWESVSLADTPGHPTGSVPGVTWNATTQTLTLNNAKVYGVSIAVHSKSIAKVHLVVQGTNTLGYVGFAGTKSGPSRRWSFLAEARSSLPAKTATASASA